MIKNIRLASMTSWNPPSRVAEAMAMSWGNAALAALEDVAIAVSFDHEEAATEIETCSHRLNSNVRSY